MMRADKLGQVLALVATFGSAILLCACQQQGGSPSKVESSSPGATNAKVGNVDVARLQPYTPGAYTPLSSCNLDVMNGSVVAGSPVKMRAGSVNTFGGWIDASGLATPGFWLRFDDTQNHRYLEAPIQLTIKRPDVVAVHPDAPSVSGFSVSVAANALPAGPYHAYLVVQSGGMTHICDSGRHIEVEP